MMTHTERGRGGVRESLPRTSTHLCLQQHRILTNASLIDLLGSQEGSQRHVLVTCFDAVLPCGQALKTELIFVEGLAVHRATVGQQKLWQCLKVTEGRRKGARAWQDHFVDILLSRECPGNLQAESEVPCNFLFERVRDCIRSARRRRLRDRTCRKNEEGVRISRDKHCVVILTRHQRR